MHHGLTKSPSYDSVAKSLAATHALLAQIEQDPSLLSDVAFMSKLSFLRQQHRNTASELGRMRVFPSCHSSAASRIPVLPPSSLPPNYYGGILHYDQLSSVPPTRHRDTVSSAHRTPLPLNTVAPYPQCPSTASNNNNYSQRRFDEYRTEYIKATQQLYEEEEKMRGERMEERGRGAKEAQHQVASRQWKSTSDLREMRRRKEEERRERVEERRREMERKKREEEERRREERERRREEWVPQVTQPRPFTMSTREPIKARYSEKFVRRLVEKRKEEEEEKKVEEENKRNYRFRAHGVPESTYKPTNPLVLKEEYVQAVRTRHRERMARWKSRSTEELSAPLHARPVPLSTYIPPRSYSVQRSKSAHERALRMLQEATTPPGLKDHEARTHVRSALRHRPCTGDNFGFHGATSVPDFKELHRKLDEKLKQAASNKPPTLPIPFSLSTTKPHTNTHDKCVEDEGAERIRARPPPRMTSPSVVRKTHAVEMRERAIRERLELKTSAVIEEQEKKREERERHLRNTHRLRAVVGDRPSVDEEIRAKSEARRRDMAEREKEYERSLREMKDRVEDRPLVIERQAMISSQHALQRRFDKAMKSVDTTVKSTTELERERRDSHDSHGTFDVAIKEQAEAQAEQYEDDFEESPSSTPKKSSTPPRLRSSSSSASSSRASSSSNSASSAPHSPPGRSPSKLSNITERTETSEP